ncbi:MAG: DUF427 domain-containing protein [Pseudonocardiales bacterium]|nr:DUF427 domain-containing protein [Pseudonocardiales bacterium]
MSLTLGGAPLSSRPRDTVNYRIDGPAHRLLFEPFPRRVRAVFGVETVLDTTSGMLLHESNLRPQLYLPRGDLRKDLLDPTDHHTHCPFKGDASYWSITVHGQAADNAVWAYLDPLPQAGWLRDHVALYWDSMDAWFDEDEQVAGHLRDPYHRADARSTSRQVRVLAGDELIAVSRRAVLLSETGLPNRFYLPADDVRTDLLEPSDTQTVCPYKGTAFYRSLRIPSGLIVNATWCYPEPLEGVGAIRDHLCFAADKIETWVDGVQRSH